MKNFLSFLAISTIVLGMTSCGGNDPQIGLPDKFVKCVFDDAYFAVNNGELDFYFLPGSGWEYDAEKNAIKYDTDGAWLHLAIYPEKRENYLGTFVSGKNMIAVRNKIENKVTVLENSNSKEGGTVTITQNADKTFNFEFKLSFDELPIYAGTVSNIKVEGLK